MKTSVPTWAIVGAIGLVVVVLAVWFYRMASGPQLPSDYDSHAPIGTKLYPPAGYSIPKEKAPPPPPPGVSMNPPAPGGASSSPAPR